MSQHKESSKRTVAAFATLLCVVCGPAVAASDDATTLEKRTLKIGDAERAYHLYVPKDLLPNKAAPLVLAFHGSGMDGNGPAFARKTQFNPLAEKEGFRRGFEV